MTEEWSFRDDDGETHGFYDTETMRAWLDAGYLASDTEVQRRIDTERRVEDFEWLGMVDDLVQNGYTQESSWYYKIDESGEEHGPYGLYILRAWITEEMLEYDTLLARCAGAGVLHQKMEQAWINDGVFEYFSLLCEIDGVFGGDGDSGDHNENDDVDDDDVDYLEGEVEPAVASSFKRASLEGLVGGAATFDPRELQLQGATAADRNQMFFQKMRDEKEQMERQDIERREAKLAAMDDDEREAYMAGEKLKLKHSMDKKKMLKRQMKGFGNKANIKGAGKKGRRGTKKK